MKMARVLAFLSVGIAVPLLSVASCSSDSGGNGSGGSSGAAGGGTGGAGGSGTGGAGGGGTGGASGTGGGGSAGSSGSGGGGPGGNAGSGGAGGASGSGGAGGMGTGGAGGASGASGTGGAGGASDAGGMSGAGGSAGHGGSAGGDAGATSGPEAGASEGGAGNCAGRALSLSSNGTSSDSDAAKAHVVVDLGADLPVGNTSRTFEFWAYIKPTDWVGEKNALFFYGTKTPNGAQFGLDFGTNGVTGMTSNHATINPFTGGGFNDDTGKDIGLTSTNAQWVHIAMTYDGTTLKTYVNGAVKISTVGSGAVTALVTASSPITLGCNDPNCFSGYFDEFRVWKVARTAAEISANYNKPLVGDETGLVVYYKFDDAAGATAAADSVTSAGHTAHPGTLSAASPAQNPTFVAPSAPAPVTCR